MSSLQQLSAFISERLAAAAAEVFGAVEKTLMEYQGEVSRSKQEIDHLRTLVLWPEVRLHRSAHQFSPRCCDEGASPEGCHEKEWAPDVSPDRRRTLSVKEEPPSYRIITAEKTGDIKAEHDGEEFLAFPSTNPESSGLPGGTLTDRLEIPQEQDEPDEQQHTGQGWSPHKDPDPDPQMKVEKIASCSPQEERHDCELPSRSVRRFYDEPRSSSPNHDQTLTNQRFYTPEKKRKDAEVDGCQLSGLTRVSLPFYSVNQSKYGKNTDGEVNGEGIKALTPTGMGPKTRQGEGSDSVGLEEDVSDLTRERRHTCPICAKRFKESSHLKDHTRIHTGEKPYQCKECGMNFRQSGALTLHMRIHTGERPYQCIDCGRRFNRKGDMETHRVTHTGERPHLCMVCGKRFKRKSNLNTHVKLHAFLYK